MSLVKNTARIVKELDSDQFRILKIFASSIKHHEILDNREIISYSKLHKDRTEFGLNKLLRYKLVLKNEKGYRLLSSGLDAYALKILVDSNIITGIGENIGIGKESDVVEAISGSNQKRAIKFFRIGRISFTDTKRKRSFEKNKNLHSWLLVNIEAAKKEYDILLKLKKTKMNITTPYYRSMHAIVMYKIEGKRLSDTVLLEDPLDILEKIIIQVKLAYDENIINGDLNEYNTIIDNENKVWIIDWPQAVARDHPNARFFIERDIKNISRYFERKYNIKYDQVGLNQIID